MKMKTWILLLVAMGAFAVPAHAQRQFLCGFTGFDYAEPGVPGGATTPTPFLGVGDGYRAVGFITSFSPMFNGTLTAGAEHTFYLYGATAQNVVFSNNVLEVDFGPHARFSIYEDPANNATYDTNPPNAFSPGTFSDGTLLLSADVNNLVLVYDYNANQGGFEGMATLDSGADLYLIPALQRGGWAMSGIAGQPNATVPTGYVDQLNGQIQIPVIVPTAHKTWGALKALYR